MRAVLFATATVTTRLGLRSISDLNHAPVTDALSAARRMTDVNPITSSFLRWPSPILEMRPRRSLPPEEFWRGTSPKKAANSRPERNRFGSVTEAASVLSV